MPVAGGTIGWLGTHEMLLAGMKMGQICGNRRILIGINVKAQDPAGGRFCTQPRRIACIGAQTVPPIKIAGCRKPR
jgi:hypothetical protein